MYDQFKHFFNNDFSTYSEFLDQVLFPVFGKNNFEQGFDILTAEPEIQKKADDANINEIKHIGTISTELAADIKLFEVVVKDKCKIAHSRTKIQQLIRSYVGTFEGAFIVFHYQNTENRSWRFSYIEKRTSNSDSTTPKRYTYLFGKTFACRTAAERFKKLSDKNQKISLQDLTDAFSVEALSIEFFDQYRSIYADFIQFISGKRYEKEKGKWVEKVKHAPNIQFETEFKSIDKDVRDYVKKMMGRLVFLQFLEKKGWLGVPADKPWGEGNPNYMKQLFDNSDQKENFLEAVLEPLFFDTLNKERTNHLAKCILGDNIKIPYLNGGLFENDELDNKVVVFPAEYFNKLFEFFGEYNFTIDENDPNDAELGVDPEMLGRIFENLLEDNKDKGAYYTPKEIVHYMCQESLTEYLCTKLDIQNEVTERDAINQLLKNKIINPILKPKIDELEKALDQVKICDPAIGSGAFPMGLLQEIFCIKGLIAHETGKEFNPAETKLNIIQNSIYGVDIEKGAVDIARLRFWLSLIVDDEKPRPLPNLDYKIMVGNSLIESYQGVDLSQLTKQTKERIGNFNLTIFDNELDLLRKNLSEKIFQYFNCNKHELKQQLKTVITQNIIHQIKEDNLNIDLSNIDISANNKFFLWHTFFADVFEKGGFDIVIGNPPYIKEYTNREAFDGFRSSPYYQGKMDIWYGFACVNIDLLKENGVECFIAQNNWITSSGASILRKKVTKESEILLFTDFGNYKVFKSAGIQTMVYLLRKIKPKSNYDVKFSLLKIDNITERVLNNFLTFAEVDREEYEKFLYKFDISKDYSKSISFSNTDICSIIERLLNKANFKLSEKEVIQGIVGAPDDAFIIDKSKLVQFNEKEKVFIKKYYTNSTGVSDQYIIYLSDKNFGNKKLKEYPNLFNHFEPFKCDLEKAKIQYNTPTKPYYFLHRERDESFFKVGSKIICQIRCVKPSFNYTEEDYYVSRAANVIKTERIDLKYLTILFNSKLLHFYYKNNGATQGNLLKYDKGPLLNVPIYLNPKKNRLFSLLYDFNKILNNSEVAFPINFPIIHISKEFQELIDGMVYELYFPELLKAHNCEIIEHLGELPEFTDNLTDDEKMEICKEIFARLNDDNHPVKINLKKMKEIKEIRIIEGLEK